MRRTTRHTALAALAALPLLALAAACRGDAALPDRPAADTAAAPVAPPVIVPPGGASGRRIVSATSTSINVSPSTVTGGARFIVRFAIRNDGADTTRMTLACNAPAIFALRRADAPPGSAPLEVSACPKAPITHVVPPGADLVLQLPSLAQAGRPPRPLEPGLYVVEATPNVIEIDGQPRTLQPVSAELRVR